MSSVNDTTLMSSTQVIKRLKATHTDKSEIKDSLINIAEKFHCLDRVAKSIGLVKEGFSFANRVSWNLVLPKLEATDNADKEPEKIDMNDIVATFSDSLNQLQDQLIPQLQKSRNNWMMNVVLIEVVFLTLLSLTIGGVTYLQGMWDFSNISFTVQPLFYERPVFSLVTGCFLLISFFTLHFSLRKYVAGQIIEKLTNEPSEFDFTGAFMKSTRIHHSIFRPDIVGWGWLSRNCLKKHDLLNDEVD